MSFYFVKSIKRLAAALLLSLVATTSAFAGIPGKCIQGSTIDWDCVCVYWCANSNGGAACNCDLNP